MDASKRLSKLSIRGIPGDEWLYLSAFAIWVAYRILYNCTFIAAFMAHTWVMHTPKACIALIVIAELWSVFRGVRWTWKSWLALGVSALLLLCAWNSGRVSVMEMIPFLFCARNRDLKLLFKVYVAVALAVVAATMLCANVGIIQNVVSNEVRMRQYVGFRYPLLPSMLIFTVTCCIVWLKRKEFDSMLAAVLFVLNVQMMFMTDSRLSFGLACLAILGGFALKRIDSRPLDSRVAWLLSTVFIIAASASVILAITYTQYIPWMSDLNCLLGGRLRLGQDGLHYLGVTLLGQNVKMPGHILSISGEQANSSYYFVDCMYLQLIIIYGVVSLVIYVLGMTFASYKVYRKGEIIFGFLLALYALHAMVDNLGVYLWMNPFLLMAAKALAEPDELPKTVQLTQ